RCLPALYQCLCVTDATAGSRSAQSWSFALSFFFFQAEDGIRDATVTGVQTCALPISPRDEAARRVRPSVRGPGATPRHLTGPERSEERRVGKECRARWLREHEKENERAKTRR